MSFLTSSDLFTSPKKKGLFPICYKTAKKMMDKGEFPLPTIQLSPGRRCWKDEDIEAYINRCEKAA